MGSGVYRVAGAFARGARRVLSYVPLLGVAAVPPEVEETESSAVRHPSRKLVFRSSTCKEKENEREREREMCLAIASEKG